MIVKRQCKNCEFNFEGTCGEYHTLYNHGGKIIDDTNCCECWEADLAYFTDTINNVPRFMREMNDDSKMNFDKLLDVLDEYNSGKGIPINFFDAIKAIYGLSMIDIAVLLDVSFGVVFRAKTRGIPKKRISQFVNALCVDHKLLETTNTSDFNELSKSCEVFYKQFNINNRLCALPQWKKKLASELAVLFQCPIQLAQEFARIDRIHWTCKMKLDDFTEVERTLINYMMKKNKNKICVDFKYNLDISSRTYLRMQYKSIDEVSWCS